jgi:F-type H+-transporting ATPase subunit epsilon
MIFKVLTQQGKTLTDTIDFAVVKSQDGEIGILDNHVPIVVSVKEGYVKLEHGDEQTFLVIEQALVEFRDHELSILALEAQIGKTLEQAKHAFDAMKKEKLELTKQETVDFFKLEKELKENIMKSKAGQL